ncbi:MULTISPECIES: glycosyltransferase family 2 protein [Butyricimonas]|uniref:Glycosyltransferase family 2 protein n=1 Tax=Butyricimonas hominis TaxID=2763032 RepID=A0ABR7CVZ7_9BACT|nr:MULTISPECIES: glycosyltransferase family 2 protein [Butyricimonas]MBC5619863.1 glycosyltransferase family 2 protein [Butyricimonas hominis]MCB6973519.1 glycosyltransferase family 2 protein [Butyricimonas synergistica]MCG4520377.1 glycosyltransferase family 2 protein [Butyricimonas sp. DFI.6.44]
MKQQTLSIIIPAYNEASTIFRLLEKVHHTRLVHDIRKEIIVVNDCSKDNTEEEILRFTETYPDCTLVYHKQPHNQGKGAAIRAGIQKITGNWTIIQDADLEYNPEDYNPLLEWMIENDGKVIYGSRFLNKTNKHSYQSFYLGGRLLSIVTNLLYGQHLTDEPTCYKMFDSGLLRSIPLKSTGFEFCPEVTAIVCRRGYKIPELPIRYYPRSIEEGKKINWKDGLIAIWVLVKIRFANKHSLE